jgi:hypothetical protein
VSATEVSKFKAEEGGLGIRVPTAWDMKKGRSSTRGPLVCGTGAKVEAGRGTRVRMSFYGTRKKGRFGVRMVYIG